MTGTQRLCTEEEGKLIHLMDEVNRIAKCIESAFKDPLFIINHTDYCRRWVFPSTLLDIERMKKTIEELEKGVKVGTKSKTEGF